MNTRLHIIVPAKDKDAANAFLDNLGYGPENFSVALTPDGAAITHYAGSGMLTDSQLLEFQDLQAAIPSVQTQSGMDFWDWVASLGLQVYSSTDV